MKTPRVSVLLPVFNAAATLTETLASIQAQSWENFEVVGIDDGSEDESGDMLLEWSRRDGRFRALLADHGGIVAAPNRGLPWCRGEYVARMDADDRMHPERLEKQLAWLEADRSLSVVSCLVEIFPRAATGEGMLVYEAWLNGLVDSAAIEREFFIESPIAHPSAMMRREELVALGGYQDRGWPEDYDLWLRYRAAGRRFAKVPEVLHYWREHPRRATHVQGRYSVENFLRAKAHYLCAGPLQERDGLVIWGAGKTGRRLAKHLEREGRAPSVFVDIAPKKIGGTLRRKPVIGPEDLPAWWLRHERPILLSAVASRGARALIREALAGLGLIEGKDFLCVA